MGIVETAVIYLILGVVVACATALYNPDLTRPYVALRLPLITACWPLFAPLLFVTSNPPPRSPGPRAAPPARVEDVCEQAKEALAQLDGAAAEMLVDEPRRIGHLAEALKRMSTQIDNMEAALQTPQFDEEAARAELERAPSRDDGRGRAIRARLRNIERLRHIHASTVADFEHALSSLEEMVSQLTLLRFAQDSSADVVSRIKALASDVEAVTDGLVST